MFWEYWVRRTEADKDQRFWERMGRTLGTTWLREDFEEDTKKRKKSLSVADPDRLNYPLSMLISPNSIHKQIQKDFSARKPKIADGEYRPERGEEIVDTSELSYEEFRDFMKNFNLPGSELG